MKATIKGRKSLEDTADLIIKQQLIDDSPIAMYTCDAKGFLSFYNKAASLLWGRKPKIGKELWCGAWKTYYPNNTPMPLEECPMAKVLKEDLYFEEAEIVIERPDHTFRRLLAFPRAIYDSDFNIIGAHNTLVDITSREFIEEKQAFLSAIVASSDDAIISKNLNGTITSWNMGAQKLFGYTEVEVLGKSVTLLIPQARLSEEDLILSQIKSGNKVDHYPTIRLDKYGNEIPVSLTVSPVKDSRGVIIGASKIARDISDELNSQNAIIQYTRDLETLNSISKTISSKLDVKSILQHVTDATVQATAATYGAFFYYNTNENSENKMLCTLSRVSKNRHRNLAVPEDIQTVFNGQAIIRSDNIINDNRFKKSITPFDTPDSDTIISSYLAVPIISVNRKLIGGLFLGHPEEAKFTAHHENLISSIAAQATVALDNSRLFEEIRDLSAKKDEFIALASHELKTPLTSIYGYLQLMARKPESAMTSRFIEKGIKQLEKLNKLVSELLDVSKIEAGKLQFNMETFDIGELLLETVEIFRFSNNSHRIILKKPKKPIYITGDKQRLEQVLINLLSNAIKYSPNAETVAVDIRTQPSWITITVKDEGMGLKPEEQKKLFTRFYRAGSTSGISGLGLGLFLSREIIERHQGTIGMKSEHGKGSEFFISLPVK